MNPSAPAPSPPEAAKGPTFAPEVFGKYFLVDKVAMGGMAEIFRAKTYGHGGFENLVVIKRILAHLSANDQFVRMFMDEAKVCALLQNANIVRIYDFGKLRENYFIAMECVEGKDVKLILRKLAERRKLLPREFAVYIAMEAAKGLDYAHKRTTLQGQPLRIVHRDVSPSNILVSYDGEVKVADFGIVKAANCAEDTDAGMLKGKFEYMSPEQASGGDLDRRSDIFSLGIILHEMLTGRRLFKTDDEIRTLERVKNGDIDPPSAQNPAIPARLDDIVMQALSRNAADRYQDARELHAALLEFLYPASPDLTQQSLAHFMADLFSEETAAERDRLEVGSRLALALHESQSVDLDPEWEEESPSSHTHPTGGGTAKAAPTPRSPLPWIAAALALLFAAAIAVFFLTRPPDSPAEVGTQSGPAAPTAGAIQLRIGPVAGRVSLDGIPAGEGADVTIGDVSTVTEHTVRVEADGYTAFEEKFTVEAGERVRLPVTLVAIAAAPTERPPAEPTPGAPADVNVAIAGFTSTPPGAEVFVEGKLVGRTPFDWDDGVAGRRYSVEFRLANYESARFTAALPEEGGRESYARTLPERIKAEGKLSTNVSGGWADIYVDGKKIGTTPIFGFSLPAGSHDVRARRDDIGLDQTKQVTVRAGETTTLPFSAN